MVYIRVRVCVNVIDAHNLKYRSQFSFTGGSKGLTRSSGVASAKWLKLPSQHTDPGCL